MRVSWLLYIYMGLFTLIGYILYYDIHYFNPDVPNTYDHEAILCSDDCPLDGIRFFLNKNKPLSRDVSDDITAQGYLPADTPVVLTVHPSVRYWKAHAYLEQMKNIYRYNPVFFHIGERQLPSLDMPYWPEDVDFSRFQETTVILEIKAGWIIKIQDTDKTYDNVAQAIERVLVSTKRPAIEFIISENADPYQQRTARHFCHITQFRCKVTYEP